MPRKVIVDVSEEGVARVDYIHFEGAACLVESQRLHALLTQFGVRIEQTTRTPKPGLLVANAAQQEHMGHLEIQEAKER